MKERRVGSSARWRRNKGPDVECSQRRQTDGCFITAVNTPAQAPQSRLPFLTIVMFLCNECQSEDQRNTHRELPGKREDGVKGRFIILSLRRAKQATFISWTWSERLMTLALIHSSVANVPVTALKVLRRVGVREACFCRSSPNTHWKHLEAWCQLVTLSAKVKQPTLSLLAASGLLFVWTERSVLWGDRGDKKKNKKKREALPSCYFSYITRYPGSERLWWKNHVKCGRHPSGKRDTGESMWSMSRPSHRSSVWLESPPKRTPPKEEVSRCLFKG